MGGWCVVSEHVDDIVTLIFQYVNLLRKLGPQEWIFRECQVCIVCSRESLLSVRK